MVKRPGTHFARTARDDVNRSGAYQRFAVRCANRRISTAGIQNHAGSQTRGRSVMPMEQEGPLIRMTMPCQDEIHAISVDDWKNVFTHLCQLKIEPIGIVGIMAASGVGRVMPKGNGPIFRACS